MTIWEKVIEGLVVNGQSEGIAEAEHAFVFLGC